MSEILSACYYGKGTAESIEHICVLKDLNVGVVDDVTDKEREELFDRGYSQALAFLTKMAAKERK
jgi:hypothetical protein